jgi:FtsP/CotA-like multicopper oxidase with cupredoxin domain
MTQSATREHDAATEHNAHAGHGTAASGPTRPQLAVVTILTLVTLAGAVILPAQRVNIGLSAQDVGGVVMPPGMIMTRDTPGGAMREMAAVLPEEAVFAAQPDAEGDQPLAPQLEDGVQVFDLETSVISWDILPGQTMQAYAFNRQVPGPRLRVVEGQRVRINVRNNLADPTSVHWHGLVLPNEMDGAAEVTQPPIEPGETFSYEFTAEDPGTFFYHSHYEPDRQQALGLYGALIIDPKDGPAYQYDHEVVIQLQEWLEREGLTYPAMSMEGGLPNFFTINGKSYPATQTIRMRVGEKLFVRFIGTHNNFVHPMHIHGGPFRIVETDGFPVPPGARLLKDTVNVGPGERYGVIWTAQRPGKWLLHCHIPHHTTNDNVEQHGGGGLMTVIEVSK